MAIPELVVVLLCVLGAGAVVTVGAAFGRHFLPGGKKDAEKETDWNQRSPEQESYMKKVRDMNQMGIYAQARHDRAMGRAEVNRHSGTGVGYDSGSGASGYGYGYHNGPHAGSSSQVYAEQKGYAGSPLVYEDDGSGYVQQPQSQFQPQPQQGNGRWGTEVA